MEIDPVICIIFAALLDFQAVKSFQWPDAAVAAVTALEKASHDAFSPDMKYNQKLRQLMFNLKVKSFLLISRIDIYIPSFHLKMMLILVSFL